MQIQTEVEENDSISSLHLNHNIFLTVVRQPCTITTKTNAIIIDTF